MLTESQLYNFPVNHFSFSSIKSYMEDRQGWFRRYVRWEFDTKRTPASFQGNVFHSVLEKYYEAERKGDRNEKMWNDKLDFIVTVCINEWKEKPDFENIDWGKSNLEESVKIIHQAVEMYFLDPPVVENVIGVEMKVVEPIEDLDGTPMPIPVKGFIDLVHKEDGKICIRDHKLITLIKNQGDFAPAFELQAAVNFFLVWKQTGEKPYKMTFDQMKKTKNSHPLKVSELTDILKSNGVVPEKGSKKDDLVELALSKKLIDPIPSQLTPYEIIFDERPEILARFLELYKRVTREIAGEPLVNFDTGVMQFIPNPFAMFSAEDAWQDFCDEVDDHKVWTWDDIKTDRARKSPDHEESLALLDDLGL